MHARSRDGTPRLPSPGLRGLRSRPWRRSSPARPPPQEPAAATAPEAGVVVSHGISAFGDLKYPKDFPHFDYVNPDAPQGGTMSFRGTAASQTFDSLNAFILKGEPAQGLGLLYDSLLAGSADEPDASYGLVAESLEYPEDRSWVIFNMRPEATFSDGDADHRRGRGLHLRGAAREGRALLQDHPQGHRERRGARRRTGSSSPSSPRPRRATCPRSPAACRSCPSTTTRPSSSPNSTLTPPVGSGAVPGRRGPARPLHPLLQEPRLLGQGPAGQRRRQQLRLLRLPVLRRQQRRLRGAEGRRVPVPPGVLLDPLGHRLRLPGAGERLGQARGARPTTPPRAPRASGSTCAARSFQDPRVREAIALMFNFEWTNETLFYGLYERTD